MEKNRLLHIFRNTPFGRETLMQSAYFCRRIGAELSIYVPKHPQFLMYFDYGVVTVDLDRAFLRAPETARDHASEVANAFAVPHRFFEPSRFTVPELPDLATDCDYMCCPRSISDLSSKIGLGYIGSRVRAIVHQAKFPVLIPSTAFKEWKSILCFFGGSANALVALRCARHLSELSQTPLQIFTQSENTKESYQEGLQKAGVWDFVETGRIEWFYFDENHFTENLYAVPHDALVVVGAYGHGVARELLFGSKMETIQTVLPNPMMIVGPGCNP